MFGFNILEAYLHFGSDSHEVDVKEILETLAAIKDAAQVASHGGSRAAMAPNS